MKKHRLITVVPHAERNWNITPPGFSSEEIKLYRKQVILIIHNDILKIQKRKRKKHKLNIKLMDFG